MNIKSARKFRKKNKQRYIATFQSSTLYLGVSLFLTIQRIKSNITRHSRLLMTALQPIVIAGPSGVGKGTLVKKLMEKYPACFGFSVSHTTRAPRPGETHGVHYNFVSKDTMLKAIENKEFIEYAHVHSNIYGTSIAAVDKVIDEGKVCILDIDIQGVESVKKSHLKCKYLFITPPSKTDLEQRLRGRNTETEDKIQVSYQF